MDPSQLYFDDRLKGVCAYCGKEAETRDHVPSRVLLDEQFPCDLPVVGACERCNNSLSQDERVVAALVDCLVCGGVEAARLRPKVKRLLAEDQRLAVQMEQALRAGGPRLREVDSIGSVVEKLAKGHMAFMEHVRSESLYSVCISDRAGMSAKDLVTFNQLPGAARFPEIGTRAFVDVFAARSSPLRSQRRSTLPANWIVVQEGRYRYAIILGNARTAIRFVLSEYLYCEAIW